MCGSYTSGKIYDLAAQFQSTLTDTANFAEQLGLTPPGVRLDDDAVRDLVNKLTFEVAEILDQYAYNAPLNERGAALIHAGIQQIAGAVMGVVASNPTGDSTNSEDTAVSAGEDVFS